MAFGKAAHTERATRLDHDPIKLNWDHGLAFCLSMIFFRKPVPTFRDHALTIDARVSTVSSRGRGRRLPPLHKTQGSRDGEFRSSFLVITMADGLATIHIPSIFDGNFRVRRPDERDGKCCGKSRDATRDAAEHCVAPSAQD